MACVNGFSGVSQEGGEKKVRQAIWKEFTDKKHKLYGNRKGVVVHCNVETSFENLVNSTKAKIKISVRPEEELVLQFTVKNNHRCDMIEFCSVMLLHSKSNFVLSENVPNYEEPLTLHPKKQISNITVSFKSANIGQYDTTVAFEFHKPELPDRITIVRDVRVFVQNTQTAHEKEESPYADQDVVADVVKRTPAAITDKDSFRVPKANKILYLSEFNVAEDGPEDQKTLAQDIQEVFKTMVTKDNYEQFFHHLLWYEESIVRRNNKHYNMTGVQIDFCNEVFNLHVPGLKEKRPALMIGNLVFIRPHNNTAKMYEGIVVSTSGDYATIGKYAPFHYTLGQLYDIRFFTSRITLERMHVAVHTSLHLETRLFPTHQTVDYEVPDLTFVNHLVQANPEQRIAVEHMVCGTSGTAPFLLHGPPGTGKTITIVETILQVLRRNEKNHVMVCTDSNMAADHVATLLAKYAALFPKDKFMLRASSKHRVWETLPASLEPYSNGTCIDSFGLVKLEEFMHYRIVITTLSHAAKFGRQLKNKKRAGYISHLFIDEAAQASEPACLIPISGLLSTTGLLVLSGDPHQLGPVVISRKASSIGLGTSFMERLLKTHPLYNSENDPRYMVMLRNNFRSDQEILDLPDKLFYNGQLRAMAEKDQLSEQDILGKNHKSHAVMFHGVVSKEQRMGKSPSYYNTMEVDMVYKYVQALVENHRVEQEDIGVVTPYARQRYYIRDRLETLDYERVDVGTVEAFQGKEKRVIIISTVRGKCSVLDADAKSQLGFLIDSKRFNVAITRAKAKVIVIGNPITLENDINWKSYIDKCRELDTFLGSDGQELRDLVATDETVSKVKPLLMEIAINKEKEEKEGNQKEEVPSER